MPSYAQSIRPYVDQELESAALAEKRGDPAQSFRHLERAHVLGQPTTVQHVRVHWQMLEWGWRQRDRREILGQVTRIIGAATKTAFGMVPTGNTGGANVSPLQPMPVPDDLARLIRQATSSSLK